MRITITTHAGDTIEIDFGKAGAGAQIASIDLAEVFAKNAPALRKLVADGLFEETPLAKSDVMPTGKAELDRAGLRACIECKKTKPEASFEVYGTKGKRRRVCSKCRGR